ncbi:MAG TPA: substrate-binding domain-containing protein [Vicinamibacteria bacterium]|nr:substrate-binding domain-containing protein [Vicinamibacteria bacterium]
MGDHIVVSLTSQDQEYQALQAEDARETGRRLGVDVEVLFAEDNGVRQIQQLFRHVHAAADERPAALLVHTRVPDGLHRVARNAAQVGIGWLLLNRTGSYLEGLRQEHPGLAVGAVTTDHVEIGRIHARQLEGLRPDGGSVLYVQGPADGPAARQRLEGIEQALRGRPYELKILNGEWTAASAEKAIAAWLRLRTSDRFEPSVVVCQNDLMARGTRMAFERHRPEWGRLPFLGCDGLPGSGRRDVDEGRLAGTVVIPSCSGPAVELAVGWARGAGAPPLHTVLPPSAYPGD